MTEKEILDSLSSDIRKRTPNVIKKVKKQIKREENIMLKNNWKLAFGGLAVLVMCLGATIFYNYNNNLKGVTVIDIDVNPSIELVLNKANKVVKLLALNEDAKEIVDEMDFIGSDYKVAVNALIGSMLRKGYITNTSNSILLSVDGDGELEDSLMAYVDGIITQSKVSAAVVTQKMSGGNSEISDLADKYDISIGKATLIKKIIEKDETQTWEKLCKLSINELNLITNPTIDKIDTVKTKGEASESSYIGCDKAKTIALNHANISISKLKVVEADLDFENEVMVYEVEFYFEGYEYDYEINALTGEIITNHKEADDDYATEEKDDDIESDDDDEEDDNDNNGNDNQYQNSNTNYIGRTKAKTIALNHADVSSSSIKDLSAEFEREKGVAIYEVEFETKDYEYDYKINALTGKIIKSYKTAQDIDDDNDIDDNEDEDDD